MTLEVALHQNGFLKVKLPMGGRVHIWHPSNPEGESSEQDIHDHPFSFISCCAAGEMINVKLIAKEDPNGQYQEMKAECISSFMPQSSPVSINKRVTLEYNGEQIVRRGEMYQMNAWEIHRTDAVFAITVFMKEKQEEGHSRLFKRIDRVSRSWTPPTDSRLQRAAEYAMKDGHVTFDQLCEIEALLHLQKTSTALTYLRSQNSVDPSVAGYHLRKFLKSPYATSGKILEEALELMEAEEQGVRVMSLIELCDLVGAIRGYMTKNFPDIDWKDLTAMSEVTERAFRNGHRATYQKLSSESPTSKG